MSISLSIWNELSDFIVAANAMKDGEWFLGILIGVTPFFVPILNSILYSRSSALRLLSRSMNATNIHEWFPFLHIIGQIRNRNELLQPSKELHIIQGIQYLNDAKKLWRTEYCSAVYFLFFCLFL